MVCELIPFWNYQHFERPVQHVRHILVGGQWVNLPQSLRPLEEAGGILASLHDSLASLVAGAWQATYLPVILTVTGIIQKGAAIHILLTAFRRFDLARPVLVHLQIIWNLDQRHFFSIDGRKLRITHTIWEEGINPVAKVSKSTMAYTWISISISFERSRIYFRSLMIICSPILRRIEFQVLRIVELLKPPLILTVAFS